MKKFFTLILGMVMATVASAQLINYPTSTTGISYDKEGSYTNTTAPKDLTVAGVSTPTLQIKNGVVSKTNGEITSINYIKLSVEGGFKAGDVVTLASVIAVASDDGKYATKVVTGPRLVWSAIDPETGAYDTECQHDFAPALNITEHADATPTDEKYTLTADAENLYLVRNGGTTLSMTKIVVEREGVGPTPDPDPDPVPDVTVWSFTTWDKETFSNYVSADGKSIVFTENIFKDGLLVTAATVETSEGSKTYSVTIDGSNKTVDGVPYTQRLKSGGAGKPNYRALAFNVAGASTIKIVACSSSKDESRTYSIVSGGQELKVCDAPAGDPVGVTYEYDGPAADIFIIPNAGVNFYAVYATNVTYEKPDVDKEIATSISNVAKTAVKNVMFNVAGQRVNAAKGLVILNGKKVVL